MTFDLQLKQKKITREKLKLELDKQVNVIFRITFPKPYFKNVTKSNTIPVSNSNF